MQLISTGQNNRRKKQVEEELVVEADSVQYTRNHGQAQYQTHDHSRKDGYNRLMYCLYLFTAQNIAGEESYNQEEDEDEQGPRGEDLLLACVGVFSVVWVGSIAAQAFEDGATNAACGHVGDVKVMLPQLHAPPDKEECWWGATGARCRVVAGVARKENWLIWRSVVQL